MPISASLGLAVVLWRLLRLGHLLFRHPAWLAVCFLQQYVAVAPHGLQDDLQQLAVEVLLLFRSVSQMRTRRQACFRFRRQVECAQQPCHSPHFLRRSGLRRVEAEEAALCGVPQRPDQLSVPQMGYGGCFTT